MPKNRARISYMAATTTTGFPIPATRSAASNVPAHAGHRRSISPRAGHALLILGHAIEYLTDEFVHQGASFTTVNGQLEAVHLLMGLNRQVYFECPEVPTFSERCRALFGLRAT